MKCKECGSEYPSEAYFPVPEICENCFKHKDANTQNELIAAAHYQTYMMTEVIEQKRVGFGRRLGALLIDVLILTGLYFIIYVSTGMMEEAEMLNARLAETGFNMQVMAKLGYDFIENNMATLLFIQLMYLLYFSLEILIGSSIGKMLLGLTIAEQDGGQVSTAQLIKRFVFKYSYIIVGFFSIYFYKIAYIKFAEYALLFVLIISLFYILTQKKQAFHDLFAHTAVFKKRDLEQEHNSITQSN